MIAKTYVPVRPRSLRTEGQDPPDVTWPEPLVADGGAELCRPLPELPEPELADLEPDEADPLEFPEPD